ncbi:MAG: phenylacetate--CoA ligase family protein [Acidobacteria bacterium]|nr:MAG: phenylacetate--CoA ligase family protein [Acidobacteriota bacterium]
MLTPLALYHRLPYPLKVLAASLRGLELRRWRYGEETPRLVAAAEERESWDEERWRAWQQERLAALLERAARRVPYYRRYWRRQGGREPWRRLERWPILRKEAVRAEPLAFLADDVRRRRMYVEHTSGSTGTPLTLYWSRATVRAWYALFEARVRRWHGVGRGDRWAHLGGQLVAASERRRPPYWVWNAGLRQLYLSSYHLAPATAAAYVDALRRHRVRYVLGYPSSLATLARLALEQGLEPPPLAVAIANAEPLYDHQRRWIESAFRCPVRDTYGMAEIACAASECGSGALHLWPEVGVLEILERDADRGVEAGGEGRIVATGLLNADMPLVRYDTGDVGALAAGDEPCTCGRRLPRLASVEGRADDLLRTPDGRVVGRLDPVFKADLPIREAQIVQRAIDRVEVKVVPAAGYDAACAAQIADRLSQRLGPEVAVDVVAVAAIPRIAGKFRAVVSELPP